MDADIQAMAEYLSYDPATGELRWRKSKNSRARVGTVVSRTTEKGYLRFFFNGRQYRVHRVAFALMTGRWPEHQIDHKNGDPADNRWENLREVSNAVNCQNRHRPKCRSGLLGAHLAGRRFSSEITVNGVRRRLGHFDTAQEAHEAYVRARQEIGAGFPVRGAPAVPQEPAHG